MIDFSGIDASSFFGSLLRKVARLLPKNFPLPIIQGPLCGFRWVLGAGVLGYWLGSYELQKQKSFILFIKSGDVVFDIGAQAGFYTLLASKMVGPCGKVFSFEPLPFNVKNIKRHLELNRIDNAKVLEVAVSAGAGNVSFLVGSSTSTGAMSEFGDIKVKTQSLDSLLDAGEIVPPKVIKMDIEGAEFLALSGAKNILEKYKPIILLATHSEEIKKKCLDFLTAYGYTFSGVVGSVEAADEIIARPI